MRVKTLGSSGARLPSASPTQSAPACRAFCRIHTTSNAVHAAVPARTSSIGRGPRLRPPASAAPSTTSAWPLPVSATKLTPSIHFADALNFVCSEVDAGTQLSAHTELRHGQSKYGATQKILALCSALCDYFRVRGSGSSSFPIADAFLHSPPMVESCAAPKAALFLAGRTRDDRSPRRSPASSALTAWQSAYYHPRLCK